MNVRTMMAGMVLVAASAAPVFAADDALRDYDRASLNSLFERAQSGEGLSGFADDDLLVTGSVGSRAKKGGKTEAPTPYPGATPLVETRTPVSRPQN